MDISEQLPILLKAESENYKIKLRVDEKGLGHFEKSDEAVREISLFGCKTDKELFETLQELVNEVFEYEIINEDEKVIFRYWGDYGRIENEIECRNISESVSDYTETDLMQKGRILFEFYSDLSKRFTENSAVNTQKANKLEFEINNEIKRFQRKAEFFSGKDKNKSEAFQSGIKILQKILRILTGKS